MPETNSAPPAAHVKSEFDQTIPDLFKEIGQREHLKPDTLNSGFYRENVEAKRIVVENIKRALNDENPQNWICVSMYLHQLEKLSSKLGEDFADQYRRWGTSRLARGIDQSLLGDKDHKYQSKVIVPVRRELRPDEFEVWIFNVSNEEISRIREIYNSPIEQDVVVEVEDNRATPKDMAQYFGASIGIISSSDQNIGEILDGVKQTLAAGEHPDSPDLLSRLRKKMLLNRLRWEEEINGKDFSHSPAAQEQRARIRELLENDKDLKISMSEAKSRVNEEILRKMALDALQREKEKSILDGLTGVYSRRYFDTAIKQQFERIKREGGSLTLLMVDADFFKQVNDRYGHPVGDRVLIDIASILKKCIRESDFVARYGGEEFVVLMSDTHKLDGEELEGIITRINKQIEENVKIEEDGIIAPNVDQKITVSIGVATYPNGKNIDSPDELIKKADKALYAAKDEGRNMAVKFVEIGLNGENQFSRVDVSPKD